MLLLVNCAIIVTEAFVRFGCWTWLGHEKSKPTKNKIFLLFQREGLSLNYWVFANLEWFIVIFKFCWLQPKELPRAFCNSQRIDTFRSKTQRRERGRKSAEVSTVDTLRIKAELDALEKDEETLGSVTLESVTVDDVASKCNISSMSELWYTTKRCNLSMNLMEMHGKWLLPHCQSGRVDAWEMYQVS